MCLIEERRDVRPAHRPSDHPRRITNNKGAFAQAKAPFLLPKPIFGYRHTADTPSLFWREWTIAVMLPTERCLQCGLHFPDRITVPRIGSFSRQARLSVESGKEQKGR